MTKILSSFTACLLLMAAMTAQAAPKTEWVFLEANGDVKHFIEKSSYENSHWLNEEYLALFRIEYSTPGRTVRAIEGMYDFNCRLKTMRVVYAQTFDSRNRLLENDGTLGRYFTPKKGSVNEMYWEAACIPAKYKR